MKSLTEEVNLRGIVGCLRMGEGGLILTAYNSFLITQILYACILMGHKISNISNRISLSYHLIPLPEE